MPMREPTPVVVRVVLTAEPDLVLLTRKPHRAYLELGISGTLEEGEDPTQTACREVWEELAIVVASLQSLATYRVGSTFEVKAYLGKCSLKSPRISDELAESRWVPHDVAFGLLYLPEHFLLLGQVLAKEGSQQFHIADYRETALSNEAISLQAEGALNVGSG